MLSMIERIVLNRFLNKKKYNQRSVYGFLCRKIFLASHKIVSKKEVEVLGSSLSSYREGVPQYNTPIKVISGFESIVKITIDPKDLFNVPWLSKELKILAVALTKSGKKYLKSLPVEVTAELLGFEEHEDIRVPLGYVVDEVFDDETRYGFGVTSIGKTPSGKLEFTLKMNVVTYPSLRSESLYPDF